MPLQRKQGVIATHTQPVVRDPDQTPAPGLHFDCDPGCPGIQRILHQLFHHTGRALHDFTGRNLICDMVGEKTDAVHDATDRACAVREATADQVGRGIEKTKIAPRPGL